MGKSTENVLELIDYRHQYGTATALLTCHWEDGNVNLPAPCEIDDTTRAGLVAASGSMQTFAPAAVAAWTQAYWTTIGAAPVRSGAPNWQEQVRSYYAR